MKFKCNLNPKSKILFLVVESQDQLIEAASTAVAAQVRDSSVRGATTLVKEFYNGNHCLQNNKVPKFYEQKNLHLLSCEI